MPYRSSLLVIDLQTGFLNGPPPAFEADRLIAVVAGLEQRARAKGVPVLFTQFDGPPGHPAEAEGPGWEIDPRVAPLPNEPVLRKSSCDSFHNTELDARLRALGVVRLYVTGCITELCVDTTCRRAMTLGYDVVLVEDGHTTADAAPDGFPEPAARLRLTNHVLAHLASEDCAISVMPSAEVTL